MIKNWIFYFLGLIGALLFHAYYFGWYSWFILQVIVLLPLFSFFLSLPAMLTAKLQMEVQKQCMRQESAYIAVRTIGGTLPLSHCRFRLRIKNVMTGASTLLQQRVTGADSWYVKINTEHVGLLRCSAEKVRIYDYLKLFRLPVRGVNDVQLMVMPPAEEPENLPNLSCFLTRQLKPKPGGGFSEEHEMRVYRPGDPLNSVHWKLSAKTEDLIVREAQEPVLGKVLLTLDLMGSAQRIDRLLGCFVWLSGWLLEHETPHRLTWIDPMTCQVASAEIEDENSLEQTLETLLSSPLREHIPSVAHHRFAGVDWRYHILSEWEVTS